MLSSCCSQGLESPASLQFTNELAQAYLMSQRMGSSTHTSFSVATSTAGGGWDAGASNIGSTARTYFSGSPGSSFAQHFFDQQQQSNQQRHPQPLRHVSSWSGMSAGRLSKQNSGQLLQQQQSEPAGSTLAATAAAAGYEGYGVLGRHSASLQSSPRGPGGLVGPYGTSRPGSPRGIQLASRPGSAGGTYPPGASRVRSEGMLGNNLARTAVLSAAASHASRGYGSSLGYPVPPDDEWGEGGVEEGVTEQPPALRARSESFKQQLQMQQQASSSTSGMTGSSSMQQQQQQRVLPVYGQVERPRRRSASMLNMSTSPRHWEDHGQPVETAGVSQDGGHGGTPRAAGSGLRAAAAVAVSLGQAAAVPSYGQQPGPGQNEEGVRPTSSSSSRALAAAIAATESALGPAPAASAGAGTSTKGGSPTRRGAVYHEGALEQEEIALARAAGTAAAAELAKRLYARQQQSAREGVGVAASAGSTNMHGPKAAAAGPSGTGCVFEAGLNSAESSRPPAMAISDSVPSFAAPFSHLPDYSTASTSTCSSVPKGVVSRSSRGSEGGGGARCNHFRAVQRSPGGSGGGAAGAHGVRGGHSWKRLTHDHGDPPAWDPKQYREVVAEQAKIWRNR